jgi:hypothetical protein
VSECVCVVRSVQSVFMRACGVCCGVVLGFILCVHYSYLVVCTVLSYTGFGCEGFASGRGTLSCLRVLASLSHSLFSFLGRSPERQLTMVQLCLHNSAVARRAGMAQVAQMWSVLALLSQPDAQVVLVNQSKSITR